MAAEPKRTAIAAAAAPAADDRPHAAAAQPQRPAILPVLLDDEQSAALLGVSRRTFHALRAEPWWPVRAVVLGPRLTRWPRAELEQAIAVMPREKSKGSEPAQLARARIERMKAGAAA